MLENFGMSRPTSRTVDLGMVMNLDWRLRQVGCISAGLLDAGHVQFRYNPKASGAASCCAAMSRTGGYPNELGVRCQDGGDSRTALETWSWRSLCVHAHSLRDVGLSSGQYQ